MIDITCALADIVTDFESLLQRSDEEPDRLEAEVGEAQVDREPPRLKLGMAIAESDLAEDDVYRWQQWRG